MLEQLETIARGKGKKSDYAILRKKFRESEEPVKKIILELTNLRGRLSQIKGGEIVAHQVNEIIFSKVGKRLIRRSIDRILAVSKKKKLDLNKSRMRLSSFATRSTHSTPASVDCSALYIPYDIVWVS